MNLTIPAGQHILAADLICIHFIFEWKFKGGGNGMYSGQHQHPQLQHVKDLAYTRVREFCGVPICPGKWHVVLSKLNCMYVCLCICH